MMLGLLRSRAPERQLEALFQPPEVEVACEGLGVAKLEVKQKAECPVSC